LCAFPAAATRMLTPCLPCRTREGAEAMGTDRIARKFAELKQAGRKGLVGYLTAGDPDAAKSLGFLREAVREGLDILELGVPFSDPTADGPTIQAASHRALAAGMTPDGVFGMVRELRRESDIPIVFCARIREVLRRRGGCRRGCAACRGPAVRGKRRA